MRDAFGGEMSRFSILTKYISMIQSDGIGKWVVEKDNDGLLKHSIQMPFVDYSEIVHSFIDDVYFFEESNRNMILNRYEDILKKNDIEWTIESMTKADISNLNAQCVLALIMGAIRAERFCEGVLLDLFNNGYIVNWLERLYNIEKVGSENGYNENESSII